MYCENRKINQQVSVVIIGELMTTLTLIVHYSTWVNVKQYFIGYGCAPFLNVHGTPSSSIHSPLFLT